MSIDELTQGQRLNLIKDLEDLLRSPGWQFLHRELSELYVVKRDQALNQLKGGETTMAMVLTGESDGLWKAVNTPAVLLETLRQATGEDTR